MKKITLLLCILMTINTFSQVNLWTARNLNNIPQDDVIDYQTQVSNFSVYQLDENSLINLLDNAPKRFDANSSPVLLEFPYVKNIFGVFEMFEVQTLAPELSVKFPSIKSYVGKARGQSTDRLRLTITPTGIYAKIYSTQGSVYINPMVKSGSFYKVFNMVDAIFPPMTCEFEDDLEEQASQDILDYSENLIVDDSTFRTFRLAIATTGEYSQYHVNAAGLSNATDAQKKAAVLAAVTVSLDRVNGILDNELSVGLQLIGNTDSFIFLDPQTDPYSSSTNVGTILNENLSFMPSAVGNSNYDIGHVLGLNSAFLASGLAIRGFICNNSGKAGGVTTTNVPVGDSFDLVLAHELGHQMGAFHTFNNNCQNNRSDNSVFEVGSGVTLMAYAGICPPNVVTGPIDYYHVASLTSIFNVISGISCGQTTPISNSPPSITSGPNYTIPRSTPFVLDASATDPNNDILTYSWEQVDNEISTQPPLPTATDGPIFRGFAPTSDSFRYFPQLSTILSNQLLTTWEVLPDVSRDMNYAVTVRDNNIVGGQNTIDFVNVDVQGAAGPFKVTSQNTSDISWSSGETVTITWDVAGTTTNGINASAVDFILSTNGGQSFDEVLVQNTPNDGTQDIIVPFGVSGQNCRLMVKASNNIFFSVNEEFFSVNSSCINNSNLVPVNIPDGVGPNQQGPVVNSVINIADNVTNITGVSVNLDVTHTYMSDLQIELQAPNGDLILLWGRNCNNENGFNISFNDFGAILPAPNSTCSNPFTGVYQPASTITDLTSIFSNGTTGNWTLLMSDFFNADIGVLNSWEIEICTTSFSVDDNLINEFSLSPNPNNGSFDLTFAQAIDRNSTISIYDIQGRFIENLDFDPNSLSQRIQLNNQYQSGVYLVEVANSKGKFVSKLIIR